MAETVLRRMRVMLAAVSALAMWTLAGCAVTRVNTSPAPPVVATIGAFEAFSGMTLPARAEHLDLRASTNEHGEPTYAVDFDLPSAELDRFTVAGQLDRSLRVTTISPDMRTTFGYRGDSSRGIRWTQGSLPSNMGIQRELFAVGTSTETAHVQVHAYRMGR